MNLSTAIDLYLRDLAVTRKPHTMQMATTILKECLAIVGDKPLEELSRDDLNQYVLRARQGGNSNRTLWNKVTRVLAVLHYHGLSLKYSKPKFVQPMPTVYSQRDLQIFFGACRTVRDLAFFKTLCHCGLRHQEAKFLHWDDVAQGMIHIRAHEEYSFIPKTHDERRVPMPDKLQQLYRQLPHRCPLVFPSGNNRPEGNWQHIVKTTAKRAGLNPAEWSLHGFRRVYATAVLRGGIDTRSAMQLLGHANIQSTMRYWRAVEPEALQAKVSKIFD